jgi:hypothetical protein
VEGTKEGAGGEGSHVAVEGMWWPSRGEIRRALRVCMTDAKTGEAGVADE